MGLGDSRVTYTLLVGKLVVGFPFVIIELYLLWLRMPLNGLLCADVPLRIYTLMVETI